MCRAEGAERMMDIRCLQWQSALRPRTKSWLLLQGNMKVSVDRKLRIHLFQILKQGEEIPDEQVSDADKVCLDRAGGAIDPEQHEGLKAACRDSRVWKGTTGFTTQTNRF